MSDNYEQLKKKLEEIFQMDQADLDFGIYRVMNAKREEINLYLDEQLKPQVKDILSSLVSGNTDEIKKRMKEIERQAKQFKADPKDNTEYQELAKRKAGDLDIDALEKEIFSDLYNFFSRYYEGGDFFSLRRYKADVYAIPYEGEEVKLHWTNRDQYYIKTSEYFTNYSFRLPKSDKRIHFRLMNVETEQNNNKEAKGKERRFILSGERSLSFDNEDLVIGIDYIPDSEDRSQEEINQATIESLQANNQLGSFAELFSIENVNDKETMVLERHLKSYTARNSFDYFIHKDLGGFLRRELDFFLKNEVLVLDDIVDQVPKDFERRQAKLNVIKQIGHKIILFLTQLENFQKKLWLKKKFVVETNWCITLDRVPEKFYTEIVANNAQREEWVRLFAIDEIKVSNGDLPEICDRVFYSEPLSEAFLKDNPYLVLDTALFDECFKQRLIAEIENLDEQTDGLLVHSENFQALSLMQNKYRGEIKCIYIDPPYNTSENTFVYKNMYKHSSWLSMIQDRVQASTSLLNVTGVFQCAIDDTETSPLRNVLDSVFGATNRVTTIVIEVNPAGQNLRPNAPALSHDYCHIYAHTIDKMEMLMRKLTKEEQERYKERDSKGAFLWDNLRRRGGNSRPSDRPGQWFPLYVNRAAKQVSVGKIPDCEEIWPIDPQGENRIWRVNPAGAERDIAAGEISVIEKAGRLEIVKKTRMPKGKKPKTLWNDSKYSTTTYGTKMLIDIIGEQRFSYPKSVHLVADCLRHWCNEGGQVLDYFGGSGTTGHAVINLNREDGGRRKYILVEMGEYFDTVTKPRIQKAIYSRKWLKGKPQKLDNLLRELKKSLADKKKEIKTLRGINDRDEYDFQKQLISGEICDLESQINEVQKLCDKGINNFGGSSHCFKTIRLESYEDTLNNLTLSVDKSSGNDLLEDSSSREQYLLSYMLDFESRDSLLDLDLFDKPFDYQLTINRLGEMGKTTIDLVETFNYLIGLNVSRQDQVRCFNVDFTRDAEGRLIIEGTMRESVTGYFSYRMLKGETRNGEQTLVIWREMTGNLEENNVALDEYFRTQIDAHMGNEWCPDVIYVNGDNNLLNIQKDEERWEVRLIEEAFHRLMFANEGV